MMFSTMSRCVCPFCGGQINLHKNSWCLCGAYATPAPEYECEDDNFLSACRDAGMGLDCQRREVVVSGFLPRNPEELIRFLFLREDL